MRLNEAGIKFIVKFEALRLKAYKCPAGVLTIGYGHTGFDPSIKEITIEQANKYLAYDLQKFEDLVNRKINVKINQKQFNALVSFCYNCGGSRDLFALINSNVVGFALKEQWEHHYITVTVNGVSIKSNGLIRRRIEEYEMYIS